MAALYPYRFLRHTMEDLHQRISYLEESIDILRTQNLVLATALRSLVRALPADMVQEVAESVRLGFDDELARLEYEDSPMTDVFHDAVHAFFGEQR
ncbi:hypothetical protein HMPREF9371_0362 [Neisseria shayeganii 871]|uniref:Uncharacterized protein n=2 Tax=Neisseria shayeganii TaxID=607712 RepID=G4CFH3_9NEIS|nr:hypothetical protein HMPREF9371_0362 [Neisseria shayeganii 871]